MSHYHADDRLVPRNGHTAIVAIVARISGCQNQKELSLEDQEDHGKEVAAELWSGPTEFRVIATKGKGEHLDRPELAEIEAMLRTKELDLLVCEDIGRIIRGAHAVRLCGIAVDHGTRVVAPNDGFSTHDENWEEELLSICRDHVGHNAHTSKRLKQKLMNRFTKFGGATACEIFGYIKPEGAKTYGDWRKDPTAEPIYKEWLRILRETLNCSAVADWLNEQKVPLGKYSRRKTWNGAMVRRISANPILKGKPARGRKVTVKHHETGKRVAVKNPEGPKYREHPHLAFWTEEDFDEINARLEEDHRRFRRKQVNGVDPRWRVPRKRTRFPGQYARCWYCGRHCVWGANGQADNLMCAGSRQWSCWNSFGFDGCLAVRKVVKAITAELYALDGFDDQFRELVRQAGLGGANLAQRRQKLSQGEAALTREKENIMAAIAAYGPKPMFQEKLAEFEVTEKYLARERQELERLANRKLQLPESVALLRQQFEEQFENLTAESLDLGTLMQKLVPEFHVYLVQLCDGGHPLPRAKVKLSLASIVPDAKHAPGLEDLLTRELTLDLFERPFQRERIRKEAVYLQAQELTQRQIIQQLTEKNVKLPVVQRALAMDRKMCELGLDDPYIVVLEPPAEYTKLRRHKNRNYRFEPLEGYERPTL